MKAVIVEFRERWKEDQKDKKRYTLEETCQKLLSIKGIGLWTVEYIAMRALKNPNAFPETDLELQKKISYFQLNPKNWIPWRAYAAILLWSIKI